MILNHHYVEEAEEWLANYASEFGYKPHSCLMAQAHHSDADVICLVCGRRCGKTTWALGHALMLVMRASRESYIAENGEDLTSRVLRDRVNMWVLGPQNDLLREVINELHAIVPSRMIVRDRSGNEPGELGQEIRGVIGEDRRMTMRLRLYDHNMRVARGVVRPNVHIQLKSAESKISMQSGGLDVLLVTEAQDVPEKMFQQALPMLSSPGRMGKLIVEGISPDSSESWFAKIARRAAVDTTGDYDLLIAETADNPLLSSKELWRIWRQRGSSMTTTEWDRVYRAVLPTKGGGFFRYVGEAAVAGTELPRPMEGRRYVAGLDIGGFDDATVMIVFDAATRAAVYRLVFENREPWEFQQTMFEQLSGMWNLQQINVDETGLGGKIAVSNLQARGLPITPIDIQQREKNELYNEYNVSLEQSTTSFPAEWIEASEQLSAIRVKSRSIRGRVFESEGSIKDDYVDALVLGHRACDPPLLNILPATAVEYEERKGIVPEAVVGRNNNGNRKRRTNMFDDWMREYKREALEAQKKVLEEQDEMFEEIYG